jgi:hypothetical protein
VFTTLLSNTSVINYNGLSGYNVEKVPLASNVTSMSQIQLMRYTDQLKLFRQVYAYNSNAYVNYVTNGTTPAYYRFQTYKEHNEFKASMALVNKLYPFQAMMSGANANGSTLGWIVPFPL